MALGCESAALRGGSCVRVLHFLSSKRCLHGMRGAPFFKATRQHCSYLPQLCLSLWPAPVLAGLAALCDSGQTAIQARDNLGSAAALCVIPLGSLAVVPRQVRVQNTYEIQGPCASAGPWHPGMWESGLLYVSVLGSLPWGPLGHLGTHSLV